MFKSLKDMKKEEKIKRIQKEQDWLKPVLRTSNVFPICCTNIFMILDHFHLSFIKRTQPRQGK